jgi:hypothetical protein
MLCLSFFVCWSGLGIVTNLSLSMKGQRDRETCWGQPPQILLSIMLYGMHHPLIFNDTQSKTERFPLSIAVHIIHIDGEIIV